MKNQDVLKAQVELSRIVNELITLEQLKETAIARINALLNRHPDAPLGAPEEIDITELTVSLKELYEKAKEISPGARECCLIFSHSIGQ